MDLAWAGARSTQRMRRPGARRRRVDRRRRLYLQHVLYCRGGPARRRDQLARAVRLRGGERALRPGRRPARTSSCSSRASTQLAKPGIAFRLVKKLLGFNADGVKRVEVVILSRNDPVSGLRVMKSVEGNELAIERAVFTRGREPWAYLRPLNANLFLSRNPEDVRDALNERVSRGGRSTRARRRTDSHPDEVRIAFDGDAVLFARRGRARVPGAGASTRSSRTRPITRRARCRPGRSSRCSRRCTGCSRPTTATRCRCACARRS